MADGRSKLQSDQHPIARFLGEDARMGGPFALLGIGYEEQESGILRARDRRLLQIERHHQCRTPDADEVRLAVHAACAQLLDQRLREQLQQRWPPGKPQGDPPAWSTRRASQLPSSVLRSARMILAASGGWNPRARRRLALLARMYRVPAVDIIRSLGFSRTASANPQREKPPIHSHSLPLPDSSIGTWVMVYLVLGVLLLGLGVQTTRALVADKPALTASPAGVENDVFAKVEPQDDRRDAAQSSTRTVRHYSALIHEIEKASRLAADDPMGGAQAVKAYMPSFFIQWTAFPRDDLEKFSASLSMIDLALQQSTQATRMFHQAIGSSASNVNPLQAIPSVAIRRHLATPVNERATFAETIDGVIEQFAVDASTDDAKWWGAWIQAVDGLHGEDENAASRLVLLALESRLRAEGGSASWSKSAALLANTLTWRARSPERVWMLGVLNDSSFSTTRVAALTNAIATHSSASGVRIDMALADDATMEDRYLLADAYRSAWSASSGENIFVEQLGDELLAAASLTGPELSGDVAESRIRELAKLNAVCWVYWRGGHAQAESMLELQRENAAPPVPQATLMLEQSTTDDRLAFALVNADRSTDELDELQRIRRDQRVGLNTAHAVVRLAMTGSSRETREAAEDVIEDHADDLSMLIAIDRSLSARRVSLRYKEMLNGLLGISLNPADDHWISHAHRVILTAMQTASSQVVYPESAALAAVMENAYTDRLAVGQSGSSLLESAQILMADLGRASLASGADQSAVAEVFQITRIKSARSKNLAQQFVAYQWGVFSLQSHYTELVVRGASPQIQHIAAELNSRIQLSRSVEDQAAQIERAQSQLWLFYFREGQL